MIVRESLEFERGKSPEEIKRLFGREFIPGEILLRPDNGYSPHSTIMVFQEKLKPDYAGHEHYVVATLGYIDTKGVAKPYGSRFEMDNYNDHNQISIDTKTRFPSKQEEFAIRRFLNKSKISKIKERIGLYPILNGKKLTLNEAINFERGGDPKKSMHLGVSEFLKDTESKFKMYYPGLMPPNEFFERSYIEGDGDLFYTNVNGISPYWTKTAQDFFKEDPYFEFVSMKRKGPGNYLLKIKFNPNKKISESLNFERGADPKRGIGIGLESPRRFQNIEEFTDFIITALPLIFGGKIPEDILTKEEDGMLPNTYYGEIANWLTERGFEMPNGNSEWEGGPSAAPKEFAYWTTPIVQRLEKILGQKRWSNY